MLFIVHEDGGWESSEWRRAWTVAATVFVLEIDDGAHEEGNVVLLQYGIAAILVVLGLQGVGNGAKLQYLWRREKKCNPIIKD